MRELILILPEIFLTLTLVFVLVGEVTYHGEKLRLISATALMGLGSAMVQTLITAQLGATAVFANALSIDGLSLFFRVIFILLAIVSVVMLLHSREVPVGRRSEYTALVLASCLGMCLAASAADLLLAFLALQFVNILAYFLAGYGKRSLPSNEAAVKYMIFGAVAGALLLYGLAILFGSTHDLNIYEIHKVLQATPLKKETGLVAFTLIFLALSFQLGVFPMHLWAPDVLEGAPTPVSAFISIGSRAAGFAVAIRFLLLLFAEPAAGQAGQWQVLGAIDWTRMVALISGLTMVVGSLLAFRQKSAKRMVGSLVIAESGALLMGLLVLDEVGISALLYNLFIQLFALTGSFYVISFLYDDLQSDRLQDLKGMLARAVPECICLILFLACLVGLPPLPGFFGKFTLIGAAVRHHWTVLALVAVGSMALSSVAVARLAFSLVGDFRVAAGPVVTASLSRHAVLGALMLPVILAGIFAQTILAWTVKSIGFILW